ncbi:MAG: alpha/beta fold hydrolase, partial [Alphaproteobacteria bacterium]
LLIFGEHDSLTPPTIGRAMAEQISDATFVEVPRSGHLINIEEAEIFNEAVLTFLNKQASG